MGILSDLFGAGRRRDVSMQGQIDGIISRLALIEVGSTGIGVTPAELTALSAEVAALRDRVATIEADVAQAHIDEGAQPPVSGPEPGPEPEPGGGDIELPEIK